MNIKRIESDIKTIDEILKNKELLEYTYMVDVLGYQL